MGYSKSVYERADRILSERRLKAERDAEKSRVHFMSQTQEPVRLRRS